MSYYAHGINLEGNLTDYSLLGNEIRELEPLSRVNLFVGPNNSGKSRFARNLATILPEVQIQFSTTPFTFSELAAQFEEIQGVTGLKRFKPRTRMAHGRRENYTLQKLRSELENPFIRTISDAKVTDTLYQLAQFLKEIQSFKPVNMMHKEETDETREKLTKATEDFRGMLTQLDEERTPKLIYIPILRGLRTLNSSKAPHIVDHNKAPSPYENRTQSDYFEEVGSSRKPSIFTGETLYWRVRNMLLGTEKQRQKIREFEEYLSEKFFSQGPHREVTLIPRIDSDVLVVKIGDEEERPIYELGDGIQSLIVLTFLVFVKEHAIFFIEEPDICLHPGMQRTLIECFCDHPEHQFFLTTHSNHMLDLTLDFDSISIFRFQKQIGDDQQSSEPRFQIECVEDGDDSVLGQLGVQNSSVFLVNATIWVEGITDRMYLRHYFNLWQRKKAAEAREDGGHFTTYQEDLHYTFVEYGGGNVMHFFDADDSEGEDEGRPHDLERLCGRSFLVMDQDGEGAKIKRKKRLEEILGDRLHVLPCREVENLIPPGVLKAIIEARENEPVNFPDDVDWEDYSGEGIGRWIQDNVVGEEHFKYANDSGNDSDSGTLYSSALKRKFARLTIQHFKREHLHDPINALMQRIYDHIAAQNPA